MNPTIMIIRGILSFVLGLILILWPGATLAVILLLFPLFVIIDGLSAIVIGQKEAKHGKWQSFIPMGILEIFIGIFVLIWPNLTLEAFVLLMALWAFVLGVGELFMAFSDRDLGSGLKWLYGIGGILTVILGILVVVYPLIISIALIWLFGLFFLVYGILIFTVGISLSGKTSSAKT